MAKYGGEDFRKIGSCVNTDACNQSIPPNAAVSTSGERKVSLKSKAALSATRLCDAFPIIQNYQETTSLLRSQQLEAEFIIRTHDSALSTTSTIILIAGSRQNAFIGDLFTFRPSASPHTDCVMIKAIQRLEYGRCT